MTLHPLKVFLPLAFILITSCATTKFIAPKLEEIHTKKGKNVGGIVVYNPHGIQRLVQARRNSAISRMREVCDPGVFKIVKEKTAKPGERNPKYKGNVEIFAGRNVRFVNYKCVYK